MRRANTRLLTKVSERPATLLAKVQPRLLRATAPSVRLAGRSSLSVLGASVTLRSTLEDPGTRPVFDVLPFARATLCRLLSWHPRSPAVIRQIECRT